MNPLMVMLVRNTRKAIRQSADEMDMSAWFVSIFDLSSYALALGHARTITAAGFMQVTATVGDIA